MSDSMPTEYLFLLNLTKPEMLGQEPRILFRQIGGNQDPSSFCQTTQRNLTEE